MITLDGFPKNKDKYLRLLEFFGEILDICQELNIRPILDGSLAVFAYTRNPEIDVNDIDTSVPEVEFPKMIKALEVKGIRYKLREWHVLQVLKDDLKIELGSAEYYLQDLPTDYEFMQIGDYRIQVLSLGTLKEFYRRSLEVRAQGAGEADKIKYERLKVKYEALEKVRG